MNSRHKFALGVIVGLTGLSALLFKYLVSMRLTVDEQIITGIRSSSPEPILLYLRHTLMI